MEEFRQHSGWNRERIESWTREDGMIIDEGMTQNLWKELKENEKSFEGRVERSCWENQQRKNKLDVDL